MTRQIHKLLRRLVVVGVWLALQTVNAQVVSASGQPQPTQVTAAVAANFVPTLQALAAAFEQQSGVSVTVVSGSTGKHFAQIRQGAPFDVFFAADQRSPALLEQRGHAVSGSRFTYAVGRLVLWGRHQHEVGAATLHDGDFPHLAIANPRLAPYGAAAKAALTELGLWQQLQPKLVRGESVNQAFHFVDSGAAELGLVALAQLQPPDCQHHSACWLVPKELHPPIEQQAIIIKPSAAARQLMQFVQSPQGKAIIRQHGYEVDEQAADKTFGSGKRP